MENRYKIGDRVQIVGNRTSHQFKIGDILEINNYDNIDEVYRCTREDGDTWWVRKEDIQKITIQENNQPQPLPVTILDKAKELVYGDRLKDYGSTTKNFKSIAVGWGEIVGTSITPEQVGLMLAWLKICRANNDNCEKEDSIIDLCGYALCIEKVKKGI